MVPPVELPSDALDVTDLVRDGGAEPRPDTGEGERAPATAGDRSLALLEARPELSTFRSLLAETEVDEFVSRAGATWTFFAPTNDALGLASAQLDVLRQEPYSALSLVMLRPGPWACLVSRAVAT